MKFVFENPGTPLEELSIDDNSLRTRGHIRLALVCNGDEMSYTFRSPEEMKDLIGAFSEMRARLERHTTDKTKDYR